MRKIVFFVLTLVVLFSGYVYAKSWEDQTNGLTGGEFYSILLDNDSTYIGTSNGLYRWNNTDDEWVRIFISRGQFKGVNHIAKGQDGTIYIATRNGFYVSRNSGENWERSLRGMGAENYCNYVVCYGEDIYLGTMKGLFYSRDRGKTWKKPNGLLGDLRIQSIAMGYDDALFIICDNELYKSTRNFKTYQKIFGSDSLGEFDSDNDDLNSEPEDGPVFLLNEVIADNENIYLSTNRGLFHSKDSGVSWPRFSDIGLLSRWINYTLIEDGI